MKTITKKDINDLERDGKPAKLVEKQPIVETAPEPEKDFVSDVLKNIEALLRELLSREIPTPNINVQPPEIKIDKTEIIPARALKNLELLVRDLIISKKTPTEISIESNSNEWETVTFVISRDKKGFIKEVTAKKG